MMKKRERTMPYTFDENILSDLHKDARGWRPRSESFWTRWNESNNDGKQVIWDGLIDELDEAIAADEAASEEAVASFEAQIASNLELGAPNREAAIRWIIDSLDLDESDRLYGGEYICWDMGLPYSMKGTFDSVMVAV